MQAKALDTQITRQSISIQELVMADAIFRLNWIPNYRIATSPQAWVIAEANQFRQGFRLFQERNIIEIEDASTILCCCPKLLSAGVIGGEHDVRAARPDALHNTNSGIELQSKPNPIEDFPCIQGNYTHEFREHFDEKIDFSKQAVL